MGSAALSSTVWIGIIVGAFLIISSLGSPPAALVMAGLAALVFGVLVVRSRNISADLVYGLGRIRYANDMLSS